VNKPTIKDVAERAGVSSSAVSMFLNDRPGISTETQAKIAEAVEELGYVPRQDKRRQHSKGFIGLVVEKLPLTLRGDYFYADVTQGIQDEAEQLGYSLAISVLNDSQNVLPRIVDEGQVSGILAIGGGDVTDELIHRVHDRGMPVVTVDNQSLTRPLDNVVVDNHRGAYLATKHLIELGHRRIAIIRGPDKYKSLAERYGGYLQAMFDAHLVPDQTLIQPSISVGIPRKGRLEMQCLLQHPDPPTAVFAVSDRTALGAMDAIYEAGLRVPDDISLVGFDDMPPDAYQYPPLTSVSSRRYDMGRIAIQRLHEVIQNQKLVPIKISMHVELIVRQSTRALNE
jgi:LacI family transcriptional regulator